MFGISARPVHLSRGFGTAEASAPALRSSLPWPPRLCLLVNDLGGSPFLVLAEDHLPRGGLQDAGDGNVDRFWNHIFCVVPHFPGAVIQGGHPLGIFLSFL